MGAGNGIRPSGRTVHNLTCWASSLNNWACFALPCFALPCLALALLVSAWFGSVQFGSVWIFHGCGCFAWVYIFIMFVPGAC